MARPVPVLTDTMTSLMYALFVTFLVGVAVQAATSTAHLAFPRTLGPWIRIHQPALACQATFKTVLQRVKHALPHA